MTGPAGGAGHDQPPWDTAETASNDYRDRLISALIVLGGVGLFIALPFGLKAGSEFFLPLAAAAVITLALSPLADWLGARGLPNSAASVLALLAMATVLALSGALVVQPALSLVDSLPQLVSRLSERLVAVTGAFGRFSQMLDSVAGQSSRGGSEAAGNLRDAIESVVYQTPAAVLQVLMTLLLSYFMLEARVRVRRQILLQRSDFAASVRASRVLRDVQSQLGAYFATTVIVAAGVGIIVGFVAWAIGWELPVMWGGLAAFLNLIPYIGPLTMALLVGLYGLSGDGPLLFALLPAAGYGALHAVEANVFTPLLMGRRLSISPAAILCSLIYFGWIWGIVGMFLAGPILLIINAVFEHGGRPNLIGFMFGEPLFAGPPGDVPDEAAP